MANTANLFAEKGKPITLVILADTAKSYFPIHNNVRIIQLPLTFGIMKKGNMISRKIKMLRDIQTLKRTLALRRPPRQIEAQFQRLRRLCQRRC